MTTDAGETPLYYHTDHMGSSEFLTSDVTQRVTSWTSYDEWGNITHNAVLKCGTRELDLVKTYTGHERDSVLGQYYAKARMYDTADKHGSTKGNKLGDKRFTAVDPVKGNVRNPQSLVQYTYVLNNPLMYVDPLGEYYIEATYNNVKGTMQYRIVEKGYVSSQLEGIAATYVPVVGDAVVAYALEKPLESKHYVGGNSLISVKDALGADVIAIGATKQLTSMRLDSVEHFLEDVENSKVLKNAGKIFTAANYGYSFVKQEEIPQYDRTVMRLVELLGGNPDKLAFSSKDEAEAFMKAMYKFIDEYDNQITKLANTLIGDTEHYFTKNGNCFRTTMDSYDGVTYHFGDDLKAKAQEDITGWKSMFKMDSTFVLGYDERLVIVIDKVGKVWNQYKHKIV